ncbi:MAG: acyl carrier protein [Catenulispora sp.]|nr:acyl carrier protein [Catenulispora sp.]
MESYQHVLESLCRIIESSVDDLTIDDISPDSDLKGELGIDSLAMFEIADKAQEQWVIKISDDELSRFTTVDSMVTFIQGAVGNHVLPVMTEV